VLVILGWVLTVPLEGILVCGVMARYIVGRWLWNLG